MSDGNHELELKELEALRFASRASRAIRTLEIHRKAISREYSERIKKIKSVLILLQQQEQSGQLSISGADTVEISPDLKRLIYNPTEAIA